MYHFNVGMYSLNFQRFEECSELYIHISLYRVIILKEVSVCDKWLTQVHRISHCKNSNCYAVINTCVMIFQRKAFFGPSNHKVKEQDQCFCDMILQNAFT